MITFFKSVFYLLLALLALYLLAAIYLWDRIELPEQSYYSLEQDHPLIQQRKINYLAEREADKAIKKAVLLAILNETATSL